MKKMKFEKLDGKIFQKISQFEKISPLGNVKFSKVGRNKFVILMDKENFRCASFPANFPESLSNKILNRKTIFLLKRFPFFCNKDKIFIKTPRNIYYENYSHLNVKNVKIISSLNQPKPEELDWFFITTAAGV